MQRLFLGQLKKGLVKAREIRDSQTSGTVWKCRLGASLYSMSKYLRVYCRLCADFSAERADQGLARTELMFQDGKNNEKQVNK